MDILHYTVDIKHLLQVQDQQTQINDFKEREKERQGIENKKRLLKYVLPFMHGVYALHNNKCKKTRDSSTGSEGLLGLSKKDIDKELNHIVKSDFHLMWLNNYQTFKTKIQNKEIMIWLNSRGGAHKSTPHLEYSMTGFKDVYGDSIEGVLNDIARYCARYTDEW